MATKKREQQDQEEVQSSEEVQTDSGETVTEPEQLIYIGPSIRKNGVGLRTNQVFLGGHPGYLEALYTEYPHIRSLFVPVDKLQESLKQIKLTGSLLNAALLSLKGV